MGNVVNSAISAGSKASGLSGAYNAVKGIVGGIEDVLGLGGPTEAERRHKAYVGYHNIIRSGDFDAMWSASSRAKYAGGKWELLWAYYNRSADANLAEAARRLAGVSREPRADSGTFAYPVGPDPTYYGGAPSSPPPVETPPPAGTGSPTGQNPPPSGNSATTAKPKPPCKYGRNPLTGKCYSKSASLASGTSAGVADTGARPKPPCKYGARVSRDDPSVLDPYGVCPKKPSQYSSGGTQARTGGRLTAKERAQNAALRRAESAVASGLTRAGSAAVKAAGGLGAAAVALGQLALIGAAGYLAYRVTAKLLTLRYQTWAELQKGVADEYRHARQELAGMTATNEGRSLTDEELRNSALWYKGASARLKALEANGTPVRDVAGVIFGE